MRIRSTPALQLLRIPRLESRTEQEASFRQGLTALAQAADAMGPPALDAVDPDALEGAVRTSLDAGLLQNMDWLSTGSAALALYELSRALPNGSTKREVRRRSFSLMYEGNATSFLPVATRLALGNASALMTPTLRARVSLCLEMPAGATINVAPLALALATRTETHRTWVAEPSTRGLASRRGAALLIEHAAREALFRFQLGDYQPKSLLQDETFKVSFGRLLADREPLVWHHAAIARGLLAAIDDPTRGQLLEELDPSLGITEWRRAGLSLVAAAALGDEEAYRSVLSLLKGPICRSDPGLPAILAAGLPRLAELEQEKAIELADLMLSSRRVDVALAICDAIHTTSLLDVPSIRHAARDALLAAGKTASPIERSTSGRALLLLDAEESGQDLGARLRLAMAAYLTGSAREAYDRAQEALAEAQSLAQFLPTADAEDAVGLGAALSALLELDASAFQTPVLSHLLLLGRSPGEQDGVVESVEQVQRFVASWLLDGIESALHSNFTRDGASADQRRLRTLLHLSDVDGHTPREAKEAEAPLGGQLLRALRVLVSRLEDGPDASVHRVLCAALGRIFDSVVRQDLLPAGDLLLIVLGGITDAFSIQALAEASTSPDIARPLRALAQFVGPDGAESDVALESMAHSELGADSRDQAATRAAARVLALSQSLAGGGGYHAEALRRVFFRLGRSLEAVAVARSHTELVETREGSSEPLRELGDAAADLTQMLQNALLHALDRPARSVSAQYDLLDLHDVVARGLDSGTPPSHDDLSNALEALIRPLPEHLGRLIEEVMFRVHQLPQTVPSDQAILKAPRRALLPDWLLPRRTIGSFHVLRPLGSGGASSVFVARRMEERHNPKAESFALKVPAYDPATARSMSEQEFFQLFREEAGALLSLPQHPNLARFVTFDLAATPKPILVMELIRGTGLDRLVRSRSLSLDRIGSYCDHILQGLEVMHGAGIGHLDIKPSNVILRDGHEPVLVDFGLSGRKLRPGCGTLEYTAPEILGVCPDNFEPTPPPADIYAFAAMTFELVTGELLFDAPDELAVVTRHVSHDGWVSGLAALDSMPGASNLARVLGSCLRRDPRLRPTAQALRPQLRQAFASVMSTPWPLSA